MAVNPYRILARKRAGEALSAEELGAVVAGAAGGGWSDAQLAAFLMAVAIRGLDGAETRALTRAMLESGEQWRLAEEVPTVGDKHSTGGVGDKVSLVLSPLLAACGQPVVMLTGRALGHTGGTADKLETLPGLDLALDRQRCLRLLERVGLAVGIATSDIAPADRRLYALRDRTATVDSLPLITASILSKKLATGAGGIVFDVKTGNGAFMSRLDDARELARLLVETCRGLGLRASALLTDMSQPLGRWVGHTVEVEETVACLEGEGPEDLMRVTRELALELSRLTGTGVTGEALDRAIASGAARRKLDEWLEAQGGDPRSLERLAERRAPEVVTLAGETAGVLAAVDNRRLGLLMAEAAGGGDGAIDAGVGLELCRRLGDEVALGEPLARAYLRRRDRRLESELAACFELGERGAPPALIGDPVAG